MFEWLQRQIRESKYDDWELYFLLVAVFISGSIYFEIGWVTEFLRSLDEFRVGYSYTASEIFIAAIQGVVIGIIGGRIYSQGDRYFAFFTDSFDTKEMAFAVRIGLMTLLGIAVGLVLPDLINKYSEFVVIQTSGAVVLFGYALIHSEIVNWRIENELPVLVAGLLLIFSPAIS